MKPRPTRMCKNKGCTNEFILHKSTDRYCSFECALENTPKKKPQKPILKVSEKKRLDNILYSKKRKVFLSRPENKYCVVANAVFDGLIDISETNFPSYVLKARDMVETNEVHHKKGRVGKLLLYVPLWLAVSTFGHMWIHNHPKKAYKLGFLVKRN